MSGPLVEINQVAAAGLAALLNTFWYAAAVVALTRVGPGYSARFNAATRYWIWTAVLGLLLLVPFLPGIVAQARSAALVRKGATAAVAPLATAPAPPAGFRRLGPFTLPINTNPGSSPWPLCVLTAWIVAAGWQLTQLLAGVRSVRRLKSLARTPAVETLPICLRRKVRLLTSTELASPVAVGYAHPAVVVPPDLFVRLGEGERRDVLLHELAHLARYDDWMALATEAIGALLILHPLAAIVLGRIEREREMTCDDFVVARTGSAGSYARSLARLHDLRWSTGTRLLAPGLLGRNSSLGDRIESLLRCGRRFSSRPSPTKLAASALLLALLLGAGGLIPGWIAIAQPSTPQSEISPRPGGAAGRTGGFEVASVRIIPANRRGLTSISPSGAEFFTARNVSLELLIEFAFRVDPYQISGKRELGSEAYAIAAKPWGNRGLTYEQLKPPLRQLLKQRFHLICHYETKSFKGYALVIAKGGPKLHATKGGSAHAYILRTGLRGQNIPMAALAGMLVFPLRRPVVDKTGLKGNYDIKLDYAPALALSSSQPSVATAAQQNLAPGVTADSSLPSIFTAVQEDVGLKLESQKVRVKMLVIDHVDRIPTEN